MPKQSLPKAWKHLAAEMRRRRDQGLDSMPSIADLAAAAGVSYATMWKAVQRAADQGALSVKPRRGIRLLDEPRVLDGPGETGRSRGNAPKWQRVAEAIGHDLYDSLPLHDDHLPEIKELCTRYDASYRTVVRALQALVSRGVVESLGRRYRRKRQDRRTGAATIILVARSRDFGIVAPSPWSDDNLRVLERLCLQQGIRLVTSSLYYRGTAWQGIREIGRVVRDSDGPVLGFVVWTAGLDFDVLSRAMSVILKEKKPVAVLDETGHTDELQAQFPSHHPLYFQFSVGREAGAAMGHYLRSKGHERVAYVTFRDTNIATSHRLQGLREVYTEDGGLGVFRVVDSFSEYSEQVRGGAFKPLFDVLEKDRAFARTVRNSRLNRIRLGLVGAIEDAAQQEEWRRRLFPALDRLAKEPAWTAWVAYNDAIALACLDYLNESTIDVPGRIALTSFDDGPDAIRNGLTSYNFNTVGHMQAMVGYVLDPKTFRGAVGGDERMYRCEGYVAERGTG